MGVTDDFLEKLISIETRLGVIESRLDRIDTNGFEAHIYEDLEHLKEGCISKWEARGLFAIITLLITVFTSIIA